MQATLEIEGVSIVLLGRFNPHIYHPVWFERHGLLQQGEGGELGDMVCTDQLSQFSTGWLNVQALRERFSAETSQRDRFEAVRDFVISTFAILPHTPLFSVGINYMSHVRLPNDDAYQAVGDSLGPKPIWQAYLSDPKLMKITMTSPRSDKLPGTINVRVEPSNKVEPYGVFCSVNHHLELGNEDDYAEGHRKLAAILNADWERLIEESREMANWLITHKLGVSNE